MQGNAGSPPGSVTPDMECSAAADMGSLMHAEFSLLFTEPSNLATRSGGRVNSTMKKRRAMTPIHVPPRFGAG